MTQPTNERRSGRTFSLRHLMLAVGVLSVVLAIGRWWYVRSTMQAWAVDEIRRLNGVVEDSEAYWSSEDNFDSNRLLGPCWKGRHRRSLLKGFGRNAAFTVTGVKVSVPLKSEEDARQLNFVLRQLPELDDLWVWNSYSAGNIESLQSRELADSHLSIVLEGLQLHGLIFQNARIQGGKTAEWIQTQRRLRYALFLGVAPEPTVLEGLCRTASMQTLEMGCVEPGSLPILSRADQLRHLILKDPPIDEVFLLSRLTDCRLTLFLTAAITDKDLATNIAALPNLVRLELPATVTDAGLRSLRDTKTLEWIAFPYADVTDRGIEMLAELPRLEWVNMVGTLGTESAVIALAKGKSKFEVHVSDTLNERRIRGECPGIFLFTRQPNANAAGIKVPGKPAAVTVSPGGG